MLFGSVMLIGKPPGVVVIEVVWLAASMIEAKAPPL
jgi:hypothetical protein